MVEAGGVYKRVLASMKPRSKTSVEPTDGALVQEAIELQ